MTSPRTTGWEIVRRNYLVYRSSWMVFLTGFLEPVLYLFSIGIGVGQLIDTFEFHGEAIPYAEFVAPAMLATSAFNGALLDSTYNVFFKLNYGKLYEGMLATSLGPLDVAVVDADLMPEYLLTYYENPRWRAAPSENPVRASPGAPPAGGLHRRQGIQRKYWCLPSR